MSQQKIAKFLSILLGPHIWGPLVLATVLLKSGLSNYQLSILLPSLLFFQVLIPLAYLFFAPKLKIVSAWDLPKREERYAFLVITLISTLISMGLVYVFGNHFLFILSIMTLLNLTVIISITTFWKISLHTSMNTLGSIMINFLFGWSLPWLYITIPLICWARFHLKRHTLWQLLAGIIVTGGLILFELNYFIS